MSKFNNVKVNVIQHPILPSMSEDEFLKSMEKSLLYKPIDSTTMPEINNMLNTCLLLYGSNYNPILFEKEGSLLLSPKLPLILFNGNIIDNGKEIELISKDLDKGFSVQIEYYNDKKFGLELQILSKVTEVHYLFKSPFAQIAFESSILSTGFTRFIQYVKKIEINE